MRNTARSKPIKHSIGKRFRILGFTLIELLVVIAILGILAAAVLVAINPNKRARQARDSQRKNDIGVLSRQWIEYGISNTSYPIGDGCGASGNAMTTLVSSGLLKKLPDDPLGSRDYCYSRHFSFATRMSVWATLESPTTAGGDDDSHLLCWTSLLNSVNETDVGSCLP